MTSTRGVAGAAAGVVAVAAGGAVVANGARLLRVRRDAKPLESLRRDHDAVVGSGLGEPLRVVVIGDSAADGFGIEDADFAFPRLFARGLATATGRRVQVRSYAVSGARTADLVTNQVPMLSVMRPDVVVASCGVNDMIHRTPLRRLAADTTELLRAIREAAPDADVAFVGCADLTEAPGFGWPLSLAVGRRCRQVNDIQSEVAAEHAEIFVTFAQRPGPAMFGRDQFHPNALGEAGMASATVEALMDVARASA